jgi:hypothetical protein
MSARTQFVEKKPPLARGLFVLALLAALARVLARLLLAATLLTTLAALTALLAALAGLLLATALLPALAATLMLAALIGSRLLTALVLIAHKRLHDLSWGKVNVPVIRTFHCSPVLVRSCSKFVVDGWLMRGCVAWQT